MTLVNSFARIAGQLGLERKPRDVVPSLEQYILEKRREKARRPPEAEEDG